MALPLLASGENLLPQPDRAFFERAWQITDGLPENTVVSALQDADGYLWVATQLGLYRFDGVHFREAEAINVAGLRSGLIRSMFLDSRGRLWVAKDRGVLICVARGRIVHILTQKEGLSPFQIRSMAEDAEQSLWLTDSKGDLYSVRDGKVVAHPEKQRAYPESAPYLLTSGTNGVVWFSCAGDIGVLRGDQRETLFTLGKVTSPLHASSRGGVWVFAEEQLHHVTLQGPVNTASDRLALRSGGSVTALLEDREGRLWTGTSSDGLYFWDATGWHKVRTSHPSILNLSSDTDGHLWVGTQGGGLNLIRPRRLDVLDLKSGLPFDAVQSVCEAKDGTLWAVGQNGQLARYAQGTWTLLGEEQGWSGGAASCIAATDQAVYVGTARKRLFRFEEGAFEAVAPTNGVLPWSVTALMADSSGRLWLASNLARQLISLKGLDLNLVELPATLPQNIRAFAEGPDGNIWAQSLEGSLFNIRNGRATEMTSLIPFAPRPIRCLHATPDGSLWLGFAGRGLGRIKEGRFMNLGIKEGLEDNYVSQIQSDEQGRLWLAGNRGLSYVARAEIDAFAQGSAKSVRSVPFNQNEAQPNLQAVIGVGNVRGREGKLLFPLLTGLAIVHPRLVSPSPSSQARLVIENVTMNGKRLASHDAPALYSAPACEGILDLRHHKSLTPLRPGVRTLEIDYTALCLSSADYLEFRYRLEGLDPEWVEAGHRRTAYFGSLPAGEYRFRLQARTYDSSWGPDEATLAFTVRPFLWQTWWFRAALLFCVLALTTLIILTLERRRTRQRFERLEHEHAVERERLRISKDLHDELGAHLTGIALLSELAQGEEAPPEEIRSDVRKIGDMARGLNRSLSEIVWAVNPRNDSVESFVNYIGHFAEEILRPAGIRCLLDIPSAILTNELSTEIRHNLFMVVKEALNNVVKHAAATRLQIGVEMDKDTFRLSLEDNGCGFTVEQVPSAQEGRTLSGNGLNNMRHRVEHLGGRFIVSSQPGKGTRITVELAVPRQAHVTPFADLTNSGDQA